MKTRQLLSITFATALIQGTASFTGKSALTRRTTSTHVFSNRRNLELRMTASNLFGSTFFSQRSAAQYDSLVNNRYSASDWLHNVFTLPRSSVLRDIRNPVITIAVWSALVSVIHRMLNASSSEILPKFAGHMCIGGAPHSYLVSSLGLLLVFRTNSAYQRFNVSALSVQECVTPARLDTFSLQHPSYLVFRRAESFGKIF